MRSWPSGRTLARRAASSRSNSNDTDHAMLTDSRTLCGRFGAVNAESDGTPIPFDPNSAWSCGNCLKRMTAESSAVR